MDTIVGLDVGYGYTKAIAGTNRAVTFPSVVGPAVDVVRILALFAIQSFGPPHGRNVALVTGLPVAWYGDREAQIQALTGEHAHELDGHPSTVRVSVATCVPQPFGSFFRTIIEPDGRLLDRQDLARRRVGIIDVGTHTTDYAVSDALRYVEPKSGSIDVAMARTYELIQRQIERETGRVLTRTEAESVAHSSHYRDAGQDIDATRIVVAAIDTVGRQIMAQATQLWGDARDIDAILVTGGGGEIFIDYIQETYPHARLVENAQTANAEGFYRYGLRKFGG